VGARGSRNGPLRQRLLSELAKIVAKEHVLTDRNVVGSYTVDWTGCYRG
jgi:hypothetical protein